MGEKTEFNIQLLIDDSYADINDESSLLDNQGKKKVFESPAKLV